MKPYYERSGIRIYVGDNREVLPHLNEPIHAVVTDPPYGLSFMGKGWDHSVPGVEFWRIINDAMLPGAHLLSFGGTRTFMRMGVYIEDAGFEVRDTLMWLYGSGFPKSHDASKAIDKAAGAERERTPYTGGIASGSGNYGGGGRIHVGTKVGPEPVTPEAEPWQGWGTALKPAFEPIILARKPLGEKSVARNVLKYGTGALNIDASRIGTDERVNRPAGNKPGGASLNMSVTGMPQDATPTTAQGRWPANVLLDEEAAAMLDGMVGERKSGGKVKGTEPSRTGQNGIYGTRGRVENAPYEDTGGPSRFFYVSKASKAERNRGLDDLPDVMTGMSNGAQIHGEGYDAGQGIGLNRVIAKKNHHPTVKPLDVMKYLVTMVTPPGGVVLDPFAGSFTTLVACAELGFPAIGIDIEEEYAEIGAKRIDWVLDQIKQGVLL